MGRQTTFTQKAADEICERMANGEPLAVICRDDHMPAYRTAYDWADANPAFAANIARARNDGHDAIACGTRETARGKGDSTQDVQRDKLIIDTDLKLLSKWDKRYADKVDVAHSGAITVEVVKFGADKASQ